MSIQKKHHFVPITYLNNFLDGNTLWALEVELAKKYPKVWSQPKSPSQICKEENFYLLDDNFRVSNPKFLELGPLFIENDVFRRIENNYENIFKLIIQKEKLNVNEIDIVADMVIQLKLRNPYYRKEVNRRRQDIVSSIEKQLINDKYYKDRFGHIPSVVKDYVFSKYVAQDQDVEAFGRNLQLSSLISREFTERDDIVKEAIIKSNWILLDGYYSNIPFMTSDNPGISVTTPYDGFVYNTRFIGNFKFYLPLSPRYCLLIKGGPLDMELFYMNRKNLNRYFVDYLTVLSINDQIIQSYNKYLISSDRTYLNKIAEANRNRL